MRVPTWGSLECSCELLFKRQLCETDLDLQGAGCPSSTRSTLLCSSVRETKVRDVPNTVPRDCHMTRPLPGEVRCVMVNLDGQGDWNDRCLEHLITGHICEDFPKEDRQLEQQPSGADVPSVLSAPFSILGVGIE